MAWKSKVGWRMKVSMRWNDEIGISWGRRHARKNRAGSEGQIDSTSKQKSGKIERVDCTFGREGCSRLDSGTGTAGAK